MHPDIVMGEPIPEIEPRVNEEVRSAIRWLARWAYWFTATYIAISVGMGFVSMSFGFRIGVVLMGLVVWTAPHLVFLKRLRARANDPWCIPIRDELSYSVLSTVIVMILTIPMWGDNGISWVVGVFGGVLIMVGLMLIVVRMRAREPGQISCKQCSYPLVGLTIPCVCPECGKMIDGLAQTTDRPRVSLPSFRWISSGLCVLGAAIVLTLFFRPGVMYSQMPRSVLLGLAPTDTPAFVELIASPMSDAERTGLIDEIIKANKHNGIWSHYSYAQNDWLVLQFSKGSMSDEQVAKILEPYEEKDLIVIDAPVDGRVGEPIELQLLSKNINLPINPGFFFRGFEIDGDDEMHSGSGYSKIRYLITKSGRKYDGDLAKGHDRPKYIFTPTNAGPVVIHARVVLALIHGWTRQTQIDWSLPVDKAFGVPVIWYRVIDLEHTIEVVP